MRLGGLGGDEVVLRDQLFGAVDFQQRIALLDLIAELGDQTGNPAGERCQHDRGGIFIVSDLADRRSLRAKRNGLNLRDLQLMHLIRDDPDKVRPLHGAFGQGDVVTADDATNDTPNSAAISQGKCVFAVIDMPRKIPQPRNPKQKKFARTKACRPSRS